MSKARGFGAFLRWPYIKAKPTPSPRRKKAGSANKFCNSGRHEPSPQNFIVRIYSGLVPAFGLTSTQRERSIRRIAAFRAEPPSRLGRMPKWPTKHLHSGLVDDTEERLARNPAVSEFERHGHPGRATSAGAALVRPNALLPDAAPVGASPLRALPATQNLTVSVALPPSKPGCADNLAARPLRSGLS